MQDAQCLYKCTGQDLEVLRECECECLREKVRETLKMEQIERS